MRPDLIPLPTLAPLLVQVRDEGSDRYTAEVVGLPAAQATAATRDQALTQLRGLVAEWLSTGRLVWLSLPSQHPLRKPAGWAKEDVLEREFLDDLARMRREDLDRTLREYEREDQGCSDTSSTPTT